MIPEILKEGKLAQKLIQIAEGGKSGVLTIEYQKAKKVVCFEHGNIRYAISNIKNEWFIEHLISTEVIDKKNTTSFMSEPAISEKVAHLLTSAGLISEEKAIVEAHKLILKIVKSCFRMQGKVQFAEGRPDLKGKIATIIEPKDVILEYYRQNAALFECKLILGKEDSIVFITPSAEEKVRALELSAAEKNLLKLIDGQTPIKSLTQISPSAPEQTMKGLTILKIMGIIDTKVKSAAEQKPAQAQIERSAEKAPTEGGNVEDDAEEKRYYNELYEKHIRSNFFKLLGVHRHASAEEIRTHYYNLAKEIHPDRFQKVSMKEIQPLMESLFARICEAYNTLMDKGARQKYEAEIFGETEPTLPSGTEKLDKGTLAKGNYLKGKKLYEEGKYNEALKFFENAVSIDPTRWEYFLQLGITQSKNPRMRSEAIAAFKKVIVMNPTSAEAYLELGILYKKSGKTNEAIYMLKCALQWEPDNALAAYELKEIEKMVSVKS